MSGYSLVTVFCSPKTTISSNEENAVSLHGKRRFLILKPSFYELCFLYLLQTMLQNKFKLVLILTIGHPFSSFEVGQLF